MRADFVPACAVRALCCLRACVCRVFTYGIYDYALRLAALLVVITAADAAASNRISTPGQIAHVHICDCKQNTTREARDNALNKVIRTLCNCNSIKTTKWTYASNVLITI